MFRFLRRVLDGPDDGLPAQLARLKAACADLPKPRQVFRDCQPATTRDEMRVILADAENLAEQRWLELERAKERELQRETQPRKVVSIGRVKA